MNLIKIENLLLILTLIILSGCSTKNLDIKTSNIDIKPAESDIILPPVKPLDLKEINWSVKDDKVCVSDDGYINIISNLLEIREYKEKADYTIKFYEDQIRGKKDAR